MSVIDQIYSELLTEELLMEESISVKASNVKKVNLVDQPPEGGGPPPDGPGGDPSGEPDDEITININDDPEEKDDQEGDDKEGDDKEGNGKEGDDSQGGDGEGKETDEDWTGGGQQTLDSHDIFDNVMDKAGMTQEEKDEFNKDIERDTEKTVDRIQNKSERQKEANRKSKGHIDGGESSKGQGLGGGDSFFDSTIQKIFKPKIDWSVFDTKYNQIKTQNENRIKAYKHKNRSKIERYLNKQVRKSDYKPELDYSKSLDTPTGRDPNSRVIIKGEQFLDINVKPLFIIALDTSGSVGQKFFDIAGSEAQGLLNHINNKMGRTKDGVYFMSWAGGDSQINVRKFNGLHKSDFKMANYQGGTDPGSIFRYIDNHLSLENGIMKLNLLKNSKNQPFSADDNIIPIENGEPSVMPFILIISDGYFSQMTQNTIKPYKGNLNQNIWYLILDGDSDACFPKNIINFKNSKL